MRFLVFWLFIFATKEVSAVPISTTSVANQNFVSGIQARNGDVYVLLRKKDRTADAKAGVYHFKRVDNYARKRLSISDDVRVHGYEGLAVDKFGHIKFFRDEGDLGTIVDMAQNVAGGNPKIHPLSPAACGPKPTSVTYTAGIAAGNEESRNMLAVSPGWVYVVSTNGKSGWYCMYPSVSTTADSECAGAPGMVDLGVENDTPLGGPTKYEAIPPLKQVGATRRPRDHCSHYRGWWDHGRQCYGLADGATFNSGPATKNWHPPIGSFYADGTRNRNGGWSIYKIEKSESSLFLDEFITQEDNALLQTAKTGSTAGEDANSLVAGKDYFTSSDCTGGPAPTVGTDFLVCHEDALNTTISFGMELTQFADCGDMCGGRGQTVDTPDIAINKGRAKFSSAGVNQDSQRAYMIKSFNSSTRGEIQTWVFQLTPDPATNSFHQNEVMYWYDGSIGIGSSYTGNRCIPHTALGAGDSVNYCISYNLGTADHVKTVQTAKRITPGPLDDSKDFIYVSNLPPSHFNVSSSFWGTGGMVWWAEESGTNLTLKYEQYNHFTGVKKSGWDLPGNSPIQANNAVPLVALGADGDNFIYLLHGNAGNSLEDEQDMRNLLSPLNLTRLNQLCQEPNRVLQGCAGAMSSVPIWSSSEGVFELQVQIQRYAGLTLEKIAPLPGSLPVKIGIVPLEGGSGASCSAIVQWPGTAATPPNMSAPGVLKAPGWTCVGGSTITGIQTVLDTYIVEMGVVNVANPPASGGNVVMDIVPLRDQAGTIVPMLQTDVYVEDQKYVFTMENPPRFNGPMAQLSLSNNTGANQYGDVPTVSNYDVAGIDIIKDSLSCPSTPCALFYDEDSIQGKATPSFIYKNMMDNLLNNQTGKVTDPADPSTKTLRYRWRVVAKTPPHSYKNYNLTHCRPLLPNASGAGLSNQNKTNLVTSGFLTMPLFAENQENGQVGVMYDSCWHNLEEGAAISGDPNLVSFSSTIPDLKFPPQLHFTFEDPGAYEVHLYLGGIRFKADDFTFLDDASQIEMYVEVSKAIHEITVGAQVPGGDIKVDKVVIANNDLSANQETRSGIYPSFADMKTNQMGSEPPSAMTTTNLVGSQGRFPVLPVMNYAKNDTNRSLMVTYEQQRTPIVAEAEIELFRIRDVKYSGSQEEDWLTDGGATTQAKFRGVGAWDYNYPGGGGVSIGSFSYNFLDKRDTHPRNWLSGNTVDNDAISVTDPTADINAGVSGDHKRLGYDATGDPETGVGVDNTGALLAQGDFENAHQGTLASCEKFSPQGYPNHDLNMIESAHAFYTWWEIKYVWFMRYKDPQGNEIKKVIRTGNLGEVFLLNLLAANDAGGWKYLAGNLAPHNIISSGSPAVDANSPLMQYVSSPAALPSGEPEDRKIRVRIPLMNSGAFFNAASLLAEKDSSLRRVFADNEGFNSLYSQIHPLSFQTPTVPTVIEIGFQIFYPSMNWDQRDQLTQVDGLPSGTAAIYYDAVPWDPTAGAIGAINWNPVGGSYSFGDTFTTWNTYGTKKDLGVAYPAQDTSVDSSLGLVLAAAQGGFYNPSASAGSYDTIQYLPPGGAAATDDFVDVAVLDLEPPELSVVSGGPFHANNGGKINEDLVLEVRDNNPYARWDSFGDVGDDTKAKKSPSLVTFYYEFGFDPRNTYGLGLRGNSTSTATAQKAYGFNLSAVCEGNVACTLSSLPAFRHSDDWGQAFSLSSSESGISYNPPDLVNSTADFYYPGNVSAWMQDGFFVKRRLATSSGGAIIAGRTSDETANEMSWSRLNANDELHFFYPPDPSLVVQGGVRTYNDSVVQVDMNMNTLLVENTDAPYYQSPSHPDGFRVRYETGSLGYVTPGNCYEDSSADPLHENPADCWIKTQWRVPKEAVIAPYFLNGMGNASIYRMYAKARDTRIFQQVSTNLVDGWATASIPAGWMSGSFGTWPTHTGTIWYRGLGAENYGDLTPGAMDPARTLSNPTQEMIDGALNNSSQRYATEVGTFTVVDNQAPNLRITLTDFKLRTRTEYVVMNTQGIPSLDVTDNEDVDSPTRALFFRSKDNRSSVNPSFSFTKIERYDQIAPTNPGVSTGFRTHSLSAATPSDQAFRIPEDVRFEIKVEAADNRDLDEIDITVRGIPASSGYTPTGLTHVSMDNFNYTLPETTSPAGNKRVYMQAKTLRMNHLYPNSGFFDVIEVVVKDGTDNERVVHIPVEVITQNVHFRDLGVESSRQ